MQVGPFRANQTSNSSRSRPRAIHAVLDEARARGAVPASFVHFVGSVAGAGAGNQGVVAVAVDAGQQGGATKTGGGTDRAGESVNEVTGLAGNALYSAGCEVGRGAGSALTVERWATGAVASNSVQK